MLSLLIILYIKKHRNRLAIVFRSLIYKKGFIAKLFVLLIAFLFICKSAFNQTKNYQYEVKKSGSRIGEIIITNVVAGATSSVSLVSAIKFRFVFLFTANSKEEVVFANGIMTYSAIYRQQNGDIKMNLKTRKAPGNYVIAINEKNEVELNIPTINYQTLCLYTTEPTLYRQVYVDRFQQMIAIQKICEHQYKVVFPDDNYNEYFYQDGICKTVKVHQSLFNVQIELKKIF